MGKSAPGQSEGRSNTTAAVAVDFTARGGCPHGGTALVASKSVVKRTGRDGELQQEWCSLPSQSARAAGSPWLPIFPSICRVFRSPCAETPPNLRSCGSPWLRKRGDYSLRGTLRRSAQLRSVPALLPFSAPTANLPNPVIFRCSEPFARSIRSWRRHYNCVFSADSSGLDAVTGREGWLGDAG